MIWRRICAWCLTEQGLKCGRCGGTDIEPMPFSKSLYRCAGCGEVSEKSDAATHTICDSCAKTHIPRKPAGWTRPEVRP